MELFNGMSTNRVGKKANATALPAAFTRCKSARASQVLRMRAQTFHARPIMEVVKSRLASCKRLLWRRRQKYENPDK
jgi:hypothetical protein